MATVNLSCLCGRTFTIDTALAGTAFPCPTCNRTMQVPRESAPPMPVVPPRQLMESTVAVTPRENPTPPARRRKTPAWFAVGLVGWIAVALIVGIPLGIRTYYNWRNDSLVRKQKILPLRQGDRLAELQREVRDRRMVLNVTGPSSLQAGAVNSYVIESKTLSGQDAPARLSVVLKGRDGKEIARQDRIESTGNYKYTVPLPAALKPDDEVTMEISAERPGSNDKPITITEQLPLERPGYATHLFTDKPMYQPGEVVAFRSLTLDRFALKPIEEDLQLMFTITDPAGQVVHRLDGSAQVQDPAQKGRLLEGPDGKAVRGLGFGEFAVPSRAAGGEYTISVTELRGRFAPEKRKFLVNRYQAPRLHKELEFTRRSYGPGETVLAAAKVVRIEGGVPLAGQPVKAAITIDGKKYDSAGNPSENADLTLKTESDGTVGVRFQLPKSIDVGDASLSIAFSDGGNVETIVRPIPVVVRRMRVDFYPEGGDLIAGVANRVYFSARTTLGRPAEMKGRILDAKGHVVAQVQTLADEKTPEANQGMGAFSFTPAAEGKYELQIDTPAGIPYKIELPGVKTAGVVLRVDSGVTNNAEPIKATVSSVGEKRRILVAAYCRGRLVASETVEVDAGQGKPVSLLPPAGVHGVFRVTAYDDRSSATVTVLNPIAERLVYRQASRFLNVALQADKQKYVPGEKVRLAVSTKDETGKSAPSIAMVSVVDKAALSLADDKTLRGMPTHFLLTTEVKRPEELEHADFLLTDSPLAAQAVDLLLGTQGWRRFAEQDPEKFEKEHTSDAARLLAAMGQVPLSVSNKRDMEAAALPELNEAQRKASAEFAKERTELASATVEASRSARDWEHITETTSVIGIIGLVLVCLAAGLIAALSQLEKAAPGSGVVLGVLGIFGMVAVFGVFALIMFIGLGAQNTFQAVGSRANWGAAESAVPAARDGQMEMARMRPDAMPPGAPAGGADPSKMVQEMAKKTAPAPKPADPAGPTGPGAPLPPREMENKSAEPVRDDKALDAGSSSDFPRPSPGESARRRFLAAAQQAQSPQRSPVAKERSFKELARNNRSLADAASFPAFVVREYAHENLPGRTTRSDFTETVYWHPVLILNNGETFVNFHLSDAVTSFQALAFVHSVDGRLGTARMDIASQLPFSLDAKLPFEVTSSDVIRVPVAVDNNTDSRRDVSLQIEARGLNRQVGDADLKLNLDPHKRGRRVFEYRPSLSIGEAKIRIDGRSDFFSDRVERTIQIVPEGFPVVGVHSGTLSRAMSANLRLPEKFTDGSLKVRAEVYPSLLADVISGLDGMLREPHGCFEQTSSSNYPNLLVLDYLQSTGQARPDVARRAMDLLERGYNRLLTFECQKPDGSGKQGYEWFGGFTPPHEALTAYGLLQFTDLNKVYDRVDSAMVERTRKFLLSRRDGNGNFLRKTDYHRFGQVSQDAFNAYIAWALCESEADADLNKEVQLLTAKAESHSDPYFLALVANCLFKRNDKAAGAKILDKLATLQSADGAMHGRESIVGSYGIDLQTEATALTVLAWLRAEQPLKYREPLQKAVRFLAGRRGGYGGFGSTQATVLALKALAQVAKDSKKLQPGQIILALNGNPILRQDFAGSAQDALTLELTPNDLKKLKPGDNEIRLEVTGDNELPAKISWHYHTLQPPSADKCPIKLTTALAKDKLEEGETVRLTATIENTSDKSQSMTTAIIGLPAGLTIPEDLKQLQDLAKPKTPLAGRDTPEHATISYFEVRGRELILYWRGLDAGQKVEVPIDLIARVPGAYRGPASRAYLYYGAENKCWTAPLIAAIEAK